jgi:hypothetical protein
MKKKLGRITLVVIIATVLLLLALQFVAATTSDSVKNGVELIPPLEQQTEQHPIYPELPFIPGYPAGLTSNGTTSRSRAISAWSRMTVRRAPLRTLPPASILLSSPIPRACQRRHCGFTILSMP